MRVLTLLAVLAVVGVCVVVPGQASVTTLSDASPPPSSPTDVSSKPTFVKFYAPWCGHCKAMAGTWEEASEKLGEFATFADLDATANEKTARKFEIRGFPTLKLFTADGVFDYSGARTVEAFEAFVKGGYHDTPSSDYPVVATKMDDVEEDESIPNLVKELDQNNFEHLTQATSGSTTGDWFVMLYAPWCGHCKQLEPAWRKLAYELEGTSVVVARVNGPRNYLVQQRFKPSGYPTLFFMHQGNMAMYEGERTFEAMLAFAQGGWREAQMVPIPPEYGMKDVIVDEALFQLQEFLLTTKQKPVPIGIAALIGFGFGCFTLGLIWILTNWAETKVGEAGIRDADAEMEAEAAAAAAAAADADETKKDK